MQTPEFHTISTPVSLISLRSFIRDSDFSSDYAIFLNQKDYDLVALKHRQNYNTSLPQPYSIDGVLILEDHMRQVQFGKIGIVLDYELPQNTVDSSNDDEARYETIYRCGWCGNIVMENGHEFDAHTRRLKIQTYEKYNNQVVKVNGMCCPNGDQ